MVMVVDMGAGNREKGVIRVVRGDVVVGGNNEAGGGCRRGRETKERRGEGRRVMVGVEQ